MNKEAHRGKVLSLLQVQTGQDLPPGIKVLVESARMCHGESVRAVLFYGSCLRTGNVQEGLADFYLLVDDYHSAFKNRALASALCIFRNDLL